MITYYELLGVACDASPSSIKAAFRKNIKIYHPDVNRAENADWITCALTQACTILSDAAQRARYDSALARIEDLTNSDTTQEHRPESPSDPRDQVRRAAEARRAEHARRAEAARTAQREKRAARELAEENAQRERLAWKRLVWEAEQQRKEEARLRKNQLRPGDKIRHYHPAGSTLFGTVFKIVHVFQADFQLAQARGVTSEPMSIAVDANGFYIFVDGRRDVVTGSAPISRLNAIARGTPELRTLLAGKTPLY